MTKITRSSSKSITLYKNVGCCIVRSILVGKLPQISDEIHPLIPNENSIKLCPKERIDLKFSNGCQIF